MIKIFLKLTYCFICITSLSFASTPLFPRTLDPQSQEFLMLTSEEELKKPPSSAPISSTQDLTISGPNGPIPIRIYTPYGEGPFPVLLYFPGGGWVKGNLDSNDALCRELSFQSEFIIVSVDYHKAPNYPFPKPLEDCYSVLEWTASNIQNYNGDNTWIAVSGDSAGGNLAAALTLLAKDRKGPVLQRQVLMYPATNFSFETFSYYQNAEGYRLTRKRMQEFWSLYLQGNDGSSPYASPLRGNLAGLPSAFIVTAEFDPLRDDGFAYANQLQNFGVSVILKHYPTVHAFIGRAYCIDLGKQAITEIANFLKTQYSMGKSY